MCAEYKDLKHHSVLGRLLGRRSGERRDTGQENQVARSWGRGVLCGCLAFGSHWRHQCLMAVRAVWFQGGDLMGKGLPGAWDPSESHCTNPGQRWEALNLAGC